MSGGRAMRAKHRAVATYVPTGTETPTAVRISSRSQTAVMHAEWRDPDDVKPTAARTAKQVNGWRTFCPLRRAFHNPEHIMAADKLREVFDVARLGYSVTRTLISTDRTSQPSTGPSKQ